MDLAEVCYERRGPQQPNRKPLRGLGGRRAGRLCSVRPPRGRIAFVHTEVYKSYESLGLGSRLARAALEDARARGLKVMPFCPFIAGFIERHLDEYGGLVAPEMLSEGRL